MVDSISLQPEVREDDDESIGSTEELIQRVEDQVTTRRRQWRTVFVCIVAGLGMAAIVVISLAGIAAVPLMHVSYVHICACYVHACMYATITSFDDIGSKFV